MDLLFSRYAGAAELVLKYEFEIGIEFVNKACEKVDEERAFQRWLCGYERELGFDEFKRQLKQPVQPISPIKEETEKETLMKVKQILEMR